MINGGSGAASQSAQSIPQRPDDRTKHHSTNSISPSKKTFQLTFQSSPMKKIKKGERCCCVCHVDAVCWVGLLLPLPLCSRNLTESSCPACVDLSALLSLRQPWRLDPNRLSLLPGCTVRGNSIPPSLNSLMERDDGPRNGGTAELLNVACSRCIERVVYWEESARQQRHQPLMSQQQVLLFGSLQQRGDYEDYNYIHEIRRNPGPHHMNNMG